VVADAVHCLSEWRRRPGPAAEARDWVMSTDRKWPFAFENLCDALGFPVESMRRRLIGDGPSMETLRQAAEGIAAAAGGRPSLQVERSARATRDAAIVRRRAEGATYAEIGRSFGLSTGHVANICCAAARAVDGMPPPTRRRPDGQLVSPRERMIVRLLAHGLGTHEIAGALAISPSTVKVHLNHVFTNLGVRGRRALVAYARRAGLLETAGPDDAGSDSSAPEAVEPASEAAC
jgi:DNA-binding CsgD family transcriptional regulator